MSIRDQIGLHPRRAKQGCEHVPMPLGGLWNPGHVRVEPGGDLGPGVPMDSGRWKTRGVVTSRKNPRRLGHGNPTRDVPLSSVSSQVRARSCCGTEPTWA